MGRMFGSLVGSSEENVRRAIAVAESVAPAILWVDEIDKAFAGSQSSGATDGGTTARVFGTFLTWLSEKNAPVFVVATANDISQLPPELLRKGRLDEIFFVDLPSRGGAGGDLPHSSGQARPRRRSSSICQALVEASQDFSGAEIEEAIISALYDAFYAQQELTTAHVLDRAGARPCRWPRRWPRRSPRSAIGPTAAPATPASFAHRKPTARRPGLKRGNAFSGWNCDRD